MGRLSARLFQQVPPVTRAMLLRWAIYAAVIGVAQLYRSRIEVWVGIGFIWAALFLILAAIIRSYSAVIAFGAYLLLAGWCLARAVSGPLIPGAPLDTDAIVIANWSFIAYLAGQRATSAYRQVIDGQVATP